MPLPSPLHEFDSLQSLWVSFVVDLSGDRSLFCLKDLILSCYQANFYFTLEPMEASFSLVLLLLMLISLDILSLSWLISWVRDSFWELTTISPIQMTLTQAESSSYIADAPVILDYIEGTLSSLPNRHQAKYRHEISRSPSSGLFSLYWPTLLWEIPF